MGDSAAAAAISGPTVPRISRIARRVASPARATSAVTAASRVAFDRRSDGRRASSHDAPRPVRRHANGAVLAKYRVFQLTEAISSTTGTR
jgi:hypothetical protein